VTVKSATTIACRLIEAFGERIATPHPELNRLSHTAARIAKAAVGDIAGLGIVSARSKSLIALAQAQASGAIVLDRRGHYAPDDTIARLAQLPGIGQWTAHYIAMRALRWPDAFPKEDIAVRNNLGGVSAMQAAEMSQAWRPWRSYAVLHIWKNPVDAARRLTTARMRTRNHEVLTA
jgi:AraC family transcriptional regulator of adaptative response / DNA-3-methyladenine glycosylase II